jgi:hypothetical protein
MDQGSQVVSRTTDSQDLSSAFPGASGFAKAFNSELYFSRGTGLVQATSGGLEEQLTSCRA